MIFADNSYYSCAFISFILFSTDSGASIGIGNGGNIQQKRANERDICTKYITPAIEHAGWSRHTHFLEEVNLTKGRIIVKGNISTRLKQKFADYVLFYKPNIPIGIIEAKDNNHSVGHGMQQALQYADMLQVPFIFSTNGDAFLEHDRTGNGEVVEREISMEGFPSPEQLWRRYCIWKGIKPESEQLVVQEYYSDGSGKMPRYYQMNAINRTMEAIANGQDRILLVMATGTGKTYTAFQIIWRLWKSGSRKRILFLADRNILVDQTRTNDFKPFGKAMTKIEKRMADKSYEIYLSLYQAVTGTEEERNIYKQFSPDFFDLIVVDECHRGSAAEDSAWHDILDYFSSATHVGLTATPKETKDVSNKTYFGEAVYTYSLKQGIEDGFLAPYKVVRIDIDKDLQGWRPTKGQLDKYGNEIQDRVYNQKDFDKNIVLEKRTELVAHKVSEFLKATNRFDKTIVFCENIDHAERMRQMLMNENSDLVSENRKYIVKITGDDAEGKAELDNFILPWEKYPVIATTSRLMTTGVDAQTCKLIVLDRRIQSMTEFKQIIGRGTRINEDYGKTFFTIMDFRKATELFADPDFDGEPVVVYQPHEGESPVPPDDLEPDLEKQLEEQESEEVKMNPPSMGRFWEEGDGRPRRYVVSDVTVEVLAERVQYYGADGKLITESLKDYTRKSVQKEFKSLDAFLKKWSSVDQKQVILEELMEQGVFFEALADEVGKDYSPFDLICHVVYGQPPLTRKERAENVKKRDYFSKYGEKARVVLQALLEKYADEGLENLTDLNVLKVQPISEMGTPVEIIQSFGGRDQYLAALKELESHLYGVA